MVRCVTVFSVALVLLAVLAAGFGAEAARAEEPVYSTVMGGTEYKELEGSSNFYVVPADGYVSYAPFWESSGEGGGGRDYPVKVVKPDGSATTYSEGLARVLLPAGSKVYGVSGMVTGGTTLSFTSSLSEYVVSVDEERIREIATEGGAAVDDVLEELKNGVDDLCCDKKT